MDNFYLPTYRYLRANKCSLVLTRPNLVRKQAAELLMRKEKVQDCYQFPLPDCWYSNSNSSTSKVSKKIGKNMVACQLYQSTQELIRSLNVNKRTIATQFCNLLQGIKFVHKFSSHAYFLSLILATSWHNYSVSLKFPVTFLLLTTNTALYNGLNGAPQRH